MDKIAAMTRNWSASRDFLASLSTRARAEGSCLACGRAEVELRTETRDARKSNGKVTLRDAVLRPTGDCRSGRRTAQCDEAHTLVISGSLADVEQTQ
jgi:hypothetical protein